MSVLEDSGSLDAARSYMEGFSRGWEEGLGKIEEKELEMANAIKCTSCGKFEEGLGYSVRIYQHQKDDNPSRPREYSKRIVAQDCLCFECASAAAEAVREVLIPEE